MKNQKSNGTYMGFNQNKKSSSVLRRNSQTSDQHKEVETGQSTFDHGFDPPTKLDSGRGGPFARADHA